MLQKLIAFRDNIILFSLGCYGLGFIFVVSYYQAFNLPIIFYIEFNDILLFALTFILPAAIIVIIVELVVIILKAIINTFYPITNKGLFSIALVLLIIVLILLNFGWLKFELNPRNQSLFFICTASILVRNVDISNKTDIIINSVVFCLFISFGIVINSDNTKLGKTNIDVQFIYNDKLYTTLYYTDLVYVGETSSYIFLYSLGKESTNVYEKEKISYLKYSNKKHNTDWHDNNYKIKYKELDLIKITPINKTSIDRYRWITQDKLEYRWAGEQSPRGISKIIIKLNEILYSNNFDFESPNKDNSFLPNGVKFLDDYKVLNEAILSGDYEVDKWWVHPSGYVNLTMKKDEGYGIYFIKNKK